MSLALYGLARFREQLTTGVANSMPTLIPSPKWCDGCAAILTGNHNCRICASLLRF